MCLKKAAGAIGALCNESVENQDAVEKNKGIGKLVGLLKNPDLPDDVSAEACVAVAVLAKGHQKNQEKVMAAGGIEPLVALLKNEQDEATQAEEAEENRSATEAASALWSLASGSPTNQVAIADANGIARLVALLGNGSARAQDQAAGALAALALNNVKNELAIAQMIVTLLGSGDSAASAKAARAISKLARAHKSNQRSIANAGGVALLVNLLVGGTDEGIELVQKEMASAIWSMAEHNEDNQVRAPHCV